MEPLAMRGKRQPMPMVREEQLPSFSANKNEKRVTFSTEKTQTYEQPLPLRPMVNPDFSKQFRTLSNVKPESVGRWVDHTPIDTTQFRTVTTAPKSSIRKIMATPQPEFHKFASRFGFEAIEYEDLLRVPELYALEFTSDTQRDNCYSIYRELSYHLRSRMKLNHQPSLAQYSNLDQSSEKEPILNIKKMDFKVYSDVIDERDSNQLFSSVISNYGTLEIDERVDVLPTKYEIREKKKTNSIQISTEQTDYYTRLSVFESVSKVEMLQLQIEREKARRPVPKDYVDVLQGKLLELLQCVIQDEQEYSRLPLAQRLKRILANIDHFRGKQVEGHAKINVLLYFFREYKELRDLQQKSVKSPLKDTPSRSLKTVRKEPREEPMKSIQTNGFTVGLPSKPQVKTQVSAAKPPPAQYWKQRQQTASRFARQRSSVSPVQPHKLPRDNDENTWFGGS